MISRDTPIFQAGGTPMTRMLMWFNHWMDMDGLKGKSTGHHGFPVKYRCFRLQNNYVYYLLEIVFPDECDVTIVEFHYKFEIVSLTNSIEKLSINPGLSIGMFHCWRVYTWQVPWMIIE